MIRQLAHVVFFTDQIDAMVASIMTDLACPSSSPSTPTTTN
jgi:hypothetical protein